MKQSAVYYVFTDLKDIFEKIIPLFEKYNIKGIKASDYEDFKKVAKLVHGKSQGYGSIMCSLHIIT